MAVQDVPREEARTDRSADADERGHADPHRIWPRHKQPRQRTDQQTDERGREVSDPAADPDVLSGFGAFRRSLSQRRVTDEGLKPSAMLAISIEVGRP